MQTANLLRGQTAHWNRGQKGEQSILHSADQLSVGALEDTQEPQHHQGVGVTAHLLGPDYLSHLLFQGAVAQVHLSDQVDDHGLLAGRDLADELVGQSVEQGVHQLAPEVEPVHHLHDSQVPQEVFRPHV